MKEIKKWRIYTTKVAYMDYEVEAENEEEAEEIFLSGCADIMQEEVYTEDIEEITELKSGTR
jgi:nicotinate-nucleotide pyrophosphorylase